MGERTKISWADATWNPVTGCTKMSPGCDHCYAETISTRLAGHTTFPNGFQVTLRPDWLDKPEHWGKPRLVFVCSMGDLLHDDVPTDYIADVWQVMARADRHRFLVLTKRPGRLRSLLHSDTFRERVEGARLGVEWPLPNVWVGTSTENQRWADIRVPVLLECPAAKHFVSAEPLLGPLSLRPWLHLHGCPAPFGGACTCRRGGLLDLVIVGGESGAWGRPMHPMWARALREEALDAGAVFHFKQWGIWAENRRGGALVMPDGTERSGALHVDGTWLTGPGADRPWLTGQPAGWTSMRRVGRSDAGRELDGRVWDGMPD